MKPGDKAYWIVSSLLFLMVAILHGLRVLLDLDLVLDGWFVPMWVSGLVAALTFVLAVHGFVYLARNK